MFFIYDVIIHPCLNYNGGLTELSLKQWLNISIFLWKNNNVYKVYIKYNISQSLYGKDDSCLLCHVRFILNGFALFAPPVNQRDVAIHSLTVNELWLSRSFGQKFTGLSMFRELSSTAPQKHPTLTHLPVDKKLAAISQTIFANAFSWI